MTAVICIALYVIAGFFLLGYWSRRDQGEGMIGYKDNDMFFVIILWPILLAAGAGEFVADKLNKKSKD